MPIMTSSSWSSANDALHASNAASAAWVVMCQGGAGGSLAVTSSPIGTCTVDVIGARSGTASTSARPSLTAAELEAGRAEAARAKAQKVDAAQSVLKRAGSAMVEADLAKTNSEFLASVLKQERQNLGGLLQSRSVVETDRASFSLSGSRMYLWGKYGMPGDPFKVQDYSPVRARLDEILTGSSIAIAKQRSAIAFLEGLTPTVDTKAAGLGDQARKLQGAYAAAMQELTALAPELASSAQVALRQELAANKSESRAFNVMVLNGFKKVHRRVPSSV